jgi:hypothetical protein
MVIYRDITPYCIMNVVGTLYLLVTVLQAKRLAGVQKSGASWMSNAKDAMSELASLADRDQTSWLGHPRDLPLEKWSFRRFLVLYPPRVLFRRIRSVLFHIVKGPSIVLNTFFKISEQSSREQEIRFCS